MNGGAFGVKNLKHLPEIKLTKILGLHKIKRKRVLFSIAGFE